MEKSTIGIKAKVDVSVLLLMILGGIVLIGAGLWFFVFVLRGAIGGAITGGACGAGGCLIFMGINAKNLPDELILMDSENVYLPKNVIPLSSIANVFIKGKTITFNLTNGKKVMQNFVANVQECQQTIVSALSQQNN